MNKNKLIVGVSVLAAVAALLLAGCAEWENITPNAVQLTQLAVELPEGPTKDAIQATALARYDAALLAQQQADQRAIEVRQAQEAQQEAQAEHQRQVALMTQEAQSVERARADQAQATRQALDSQERANSIEATRQAQEWEVEATRQATIVEATRQAQEWEVEATRQAQAFAIEQTATAEQRAAQETQVAVQATTTAEYQAAQAVIATQTAVVQAMQNNATATVVQATAQAVRLQAERERFYQPFKIGGLILLAVICVLAVAWLAWRFAQVLEDRARLVRRNAGDGEPIMILSRDRIALPLRQFGAYVDMTRGEENAPLLAPTAEAQEATTMRQQTANLAQASQAAAIARAQHKPVPNTTILPPGARRARLRPAQRKQEPGLLGAVGQDSIPPRLLEAIDAQWTEIEEV